MRLDRHVASDRRSRQAAAPQFAQLLHVAQVAGHGAVIAFDRINLSTRSLMGARELTT
jgi:hypothetical protein